MEISKPLFSTISRYSDELLAGQTRLISRHRWEIIYSKAALGPTQSPSEQILGEVEQVRHEDDYSPPSSAEANIGGAIPPLPV